MRSLLYFMAALLIFAACKREPKAEPEAAPADTVEVVEPVDTDSVVVPEPPKTADENFDDFLYSFMKSRRRQLARISFPLPNIVDGIDHPVQKSAWKFDPLFSNHDVYTIFFNHVPSRNYGVDTALKKVTFEWIYLADERVKDYEFRRVGGRWMLTSLNTHSWRGDENSDFYKFYYNFVTDDDFQLNHIANPFNFKTFDDETYEIVDGTLDSQQWPDFKPELPSDIVTNIKYELPAKRSDYRVVRILSPSAEMNCELHFKKFDNSWKLTRLNNL